MKYTIEGFSQKELVANGLDAVDAVILRWFVDFYSSNLMEKNDGYGWVKYSYVIESLPILGITNTEVMGRRFKKFLDAGLMTCVITRDPLYRKGNYTYFKLTEKYEKLIDSSVYMHTGKDIDERTHVDSKVETHVDSKVGTDSSIMYSKDMVGVADSSLAQHTGKVKVKTNAKMGRKKEMTEEETKAYHYIQDKFKTQYEGLYEQQYPFSAKECACIKKIIKMIRGKDDFELRFNIFLRKFVTDDYWSSTIFCLPSKFISKFGELVVMKNKEPKSFMDMPAYKQGGSV